MGTTELPHNHCAAAAYLAGTTERPPPPAAVELALLRDGRCAPEDEDPRGSMPGRCKPSAPLSRPPGVAVLDRAAGRVSVAAVPAGCRPERLLSAGGVGLLFCASPGRPDQTDLFVADRSAAWVAEGPLPVAATDVSSLSMAPDGTLLVRAAWGRRPEYRAFVRSPRPLGDATAWRALDLAGAFEVRVDLGGGAVLFETSATAVLPGWFTVWLDGPEMPRAQLSGRIPVHGSLLDAEIEGRRIALWQHHDVLSGDCDLRAGPAPRHASSKWLLTEAGGVAPAPIGGATPRP